MILLGSRARPKSKGMFRAVSKEYQGNKITNEFSPNASAVELCLGMLCLGKDAVGKRNALKALYKLVYRTVFNDIVPHTSSLS